ncbi:MAG: lipoyl(octanoyl) transferase LipB [Phycisphaeraceae bacterium]|nr:lipoyl(octanoyl) transferase LipB [Phycisphaeraceae bacterium]
MLRVTDLGRMRYREALALQREAHARVLADMTVMGEVLLVEHDPPVITLGRRSESRSHLVAAPDRLAALGVEVEESDRGGDITWHGPGQLVAYPILALDRLRLRIHPYMRLLEQVVIDLIADLGVEGDRDPSATGVWVGSRKICAMGVRVSRWVTTHGLALNVDPDLASFELIVPCGLHGRPVTSLRREVEAKGGTPPPMTVVKNSLVNHLERHLQQARTPSH